MEYKGFYYLTLDDCEDREGDYFCQIFADEEMDLEIDHLFVRAAELEEFEGDVEAAVQSHIDEHFEQFKELASAAKKYVLRISNKVTAIQWTGSNDKKIAKFMEKDILDLTFSMNSNLLKVGTMRVPVNDYIVHDPLDGHFIHMSNDEFNKKYKLEKKIVKLKIKGLLKKHKQLETETEAFILDAIRQNGGRITIPLESEEEYNSETSVTMYKKHGGNINVNITDIYTVIHGQNSTTDIKADGFDCADGFGKGTGFDVLPEHYYHILGIINTTLN